MTRTIVRRIFVLGAALLWFSIGSSPLHLSAAQQTVAADSDQLPADFVLTMTPGTLDSAGAAAGGGVLGRRSNGSLLGVDSIPNWSSYFYDPGLVPTSPTDGYPQYTWPYTMVGRSPFSGGDEAEHEGGTTWINAPIVPVTLDLRNADGTPRFVNGHPLISSPSSFITPVLNSPIFTKTSFDSSNRPTQYTDAVQRAEFYSAADEGWHTMLRPVVARGRTMTLRAGTYHFALNPDGTCCRYVLIDIDAFASALFPPTPTDTSTVMGAAENGHDIRTTDLSTFLFPNAFLYFTTPSNCCVLGFHSYDQEPGGAANGWRERRYVMNYSSWVSPGLFGSAFTDITALSHELSETFNDPFVNNTTPIWLSPNGNCQNNLETGDVIEGLPNSVFPITLNGFTYHPQNEALLPWFAGVSHSPAIHGAYSYPDITVLTTPATSLRPDCKTPAGLATAPNNQ
jgi:hypothetical protein